MVNNCASLRLRLGPTVAQESHKEKKWTKQLWNLGAQKRDCTCLHFFLHSMRSLSAFTLIRVNQSLNSLQTTTKNSFASLANHYILHPLNTSKSIIMRVLRFSGSLPSIASFLGIHFKLHVSLSINKYNNKFRESWWQRQWKQCTHPFWQITANEHSSLA